MIKHNRLVLLVLVAVIVFAIWQNYQLHMEHKTERLHIAHTAHRAAYFLNSTQTAIELINKNNEWDDMNERKSLLDRLFNTRANLIHANSTVDDFIPLVSFENRQNMGNILSQFEIWQSEVITILDKRSSLTTEDKAYISELSQIVSKVDGFYPLQKNDFEGIMAAFAKLNEEWYNTLNKR